MKITEIEWKEGNVYTTSKGDKVIVKGFTLITEKGVQLVDHYNLKYIARELELTPVIDWSTVAVDTPVWVYYYDKWVARHFASYSEKEGVVEYYSEGFTSHTTSGYMSSCCVGYASLTKPK